MEAEFNELRKNLKKDVLVYSKHVYNMAIDEAIEVLPENEYREETIENLLKLKRKV